MTRVSERTTGTLIALAAVLAISPDALLISAIKADTWTLVFWRGLLTALTLSVSLVTIHGREAPRETFRIGWPGLLVGFFFGASTMSFVTAVRHTAAANALVIIAAMPLFAAILTRIVLRERVPFRTWAAVAAGFAGLGVIFMGSIRRGSPLGDALALATAVLMASNFVIIRRQKRINMLPAVVLSGIMTTAVTAFPGRPMALSTGDILLVTALGTIVLPVPLALMTIAPKLIPPAEVGLIMLLETFLGPFWVWLAMGEEPLRETFLGGGILVLTLVLHSVTALREQQRRPGRASVQQME